MAATSDAPWDGSAARFTPQQWRRSCLIDTGQGDPGDKSRYKLPVREPSGTLNRRGLAAAAGRLNQTQGVSAGQRAAATRKLLELYAQAGMDAPDHLHELTGHAAPTTPAPGSNAADSVASLERCLASGSVELRSAGRTIGGYAAVFGARSRRMSFGYEIVDRGFFNASRDANWNGVCCRWDHDSSRLLGSTAAGTLRLSVDTTGLSYDVDLPECRRDLYELVARRDVAQSSFSFFDATDTWGYTDGQPLRTLISGTLIDVAPLGAERAAYPQASVALRSLARYVGADVADVEMRARSGQLAHFFTRSDNRGDVPASTLEAMARTEARRPAASRPLYVIQHEHMQRLNHLHAMRARWH